MRRIMPGALWISLITLGLIEALQFVLMFRQPLLITSLVLNALLMWGIAAGARIAFIAACLFASAGAIRSLLHHLPTGMAVLLINAIVLAPMLMHWRYFFPSDSGPMGSVSINRARVTTDSARP
jgi:hypothetical protein